jgi:hypothetical protein
LLILNNNYKKNKTIDKPIEIPIVAHDSKFNYVNYSTPQANRQAEYIKYLSASVKIGVNGGTGSGTIVYYDESKNQAYVASCGHLWKNNRDYNKNNSLEKCRVITWYHNEEKIQETQSYIGEVLFWSNYKGYDTSLIVFKPDWKPYYFAIAPINYKINIGENLNSLGCDHGTEVARYETEVVGYSEQNLVCKKNIPRPGRSGGGLLDKNGYYVATCVATTDVDGIYGVGYFTSLKSIHYIYSKNGFDWLLNIEPILKNNNSELIFPNHSFMILD